MDKIFSKARLLWILPLLGSFFLTRFLLAIPGEMSDVFSFLQWICIFVQVGMFVLAIWGWGGALPRKWRTASSSIENILFGTLIFIGWMWLAGALGLLGERFVWIHLGFLLVGICLSSAPALSEFNWKKVDPKVLMALVPVTVFFLMGILQAMHMQVVEDVFSYHLYAPHQWWKVGRVYFDQHYPHLYMASYWEMLYLWAYPIFPVGSLQSWFVLAFAQLLHVLLGLFGSFFLLLQIFRGTTGKLEWRLLAALFGVSLFPLLWTSWHAKNDYGSLLLGLGAIYFLLAQKYFRAGVFIGLSIAVKMSAIFSVSAIPVVLVIFLRHRLSVGNRRQWLQFLLGITLSILPLFLRNFVATANPFFPFLVEQLSPNVTSATLNTVIYSVLGNHSESRDEVFTVFFVQFLREPLLVVSLIIVLAGLWKKMNFQLLSLATVAVVPLFTASLWLGNWLLDSIFVRYVALSLVLANAIPFAVLARVADSGKSKSLQWLGLVAVIFLWFFTKPFLPWDSLKEFPSQGVFYADYLNNVPGIKCRQWLTKSVSPSQLVISIEDDHLFLMDGVSIRVAAHDPEIDPIIKNASDLSYLSKLQSIGGKYVFHVRRGVGRAYYKNSEKIHQALLQHAGMVVGDDECVVVAL